MRTLHEAIFNALSMAILVFWSAVVANEIQKLRFTHDANP